MTTYHAHDESDSPETTASSSSSPVIGFDMGGTSTDVSRYDGEYDHIFETTIAGVCIQAPQVSLSQLKATPIGHSHNTNSEVL